MLDTMVNLYSFMSPTINQSGDGMDVCDALPTSRGVRTIFVQSEYDYSLRHGVYVRCLTNQSAAIAYVTGCTYAFRPIKTQYCHDRTASISMHSLAQPQKRGLKTSYYTTAVATRGFTRSGDHQAAF